MCILLHPYSVTLNSEITHLVFWEPQPHKRKRDLIMVK